MSSNCPEILIQLAEIRKPFFQKRNIINWSRREKTSRNWVKVWTLKYYNKGPKTRAFCFVFPVSEIYRFPSKYLPVQIQQ